MFGCLQKGYMNYAFTEFYMLPCPQLIFPSKTWFFGNLLEFSAAAEITLKNQSIFPTF
jgi:hypothetical protein